MRRAFENHPPENQPPRDARAKRHAAVEASAGSERERAAAELWRRPARDAGRWEEPPAAASRLPLIAAIVAVVLGAMALIGLREKIVRIAPPAAALYSAIGLKVNLAGLELRGVSSKIVTEGARKVLTVEGEIVNLRREANRVPPVTLSVRGADGQAKYAWTTQAPKTRLEAGEKVMFRARLASPPADGADVLVRFAGLDADARK